MISNRLVRRYADEVSSKFYHLDNGGSYERDVPRIYGAPEYIANNVKSECNTLISPPRSFIAEIPDALVRPPGFVITADSIVENALVSLNGPSGLEHWLPVHPEQDGGYQPKEFYWGISRTLERPTVLLCQNASINYGHWLIECPPKIDLVKEKYYLSDLDFIANFPSRIDQHCFDALAIEGVSAKQITMLDHDSIRIKRLIYPSPVTRHPWVTTIRSVRYLRDFALRALVHTRMDGGSEMLYLTRNSIGRRMLTNEDEVQAKLESIGFITIIPEEMTLYQQIAAFANAKVVVGNLGGSFSNIVFSPNKLSVVALTTEFMHDDFFFDITSNKKGYYTSIHGKATDPTAGMQSDFTIDADFVIERVRRELDRHGLS